MVKSFLNALFGGLGRTFGRIIAYIIIALIFFFIYENAHAEEININSSVYGDTGYNNMYWGQNYYNGSLSSSNFSIGTRYTGRLAVFVLDIRRSFVANTTYSIYVYAPTNDFRNTLEGVIVDDTTNVTGCTTISSQFISKTKLKSTFVCPQNTSRIQMQWYADEGSYLTGDSNFNINKITLETQTSTGSNNDDIINNNNQNTDEIINNNNSNTEDIINNATQNTADIINSQEELLGSCYTNVFNYSNYSYNNSRYTLTQITNGFTLTANGNYSNGSFPLTYSINLKPNTTYYFSSNSSKNVSSNGLASFYIYDGSSQLVKFTFNSDNFSFTTNSSTTYSFRFYLTNNQVSGDTFTFSNMMLVEGTSYSGDYIPYNQKKCISKVDGVTGAIDDLSNSINDSSDIDTNIFSTWLNNFNPINNPLGSVITLPISLAQKIVGYNSESCMTINLGSLFGTSLLLRCFSLSSVLPDNAGSLVSIIDTIMAISLLVVIIKNSYETIANIISLGGENKVKSHFRLPTPLEFMSSILNGNGYSEYVDYR